ncbi:uncharacterized protein [Apostichopus japonicus]|uniref:uncharacterized protein isoform X2 n=1 Tax=Stichopus japonicus TaxID=307972 RepID=UPI003AB40C6E
MTELKERLRAEGNSDEEVLTSSLSIKDRIRRLQGITKPNDAAVREEISSTKKTTEFQELTNELHELKSKKTELEEKLSREQEKGNEYKESLDKKTTEFQELTNELHELKSQKKELEKKLSREQEKGNEYKESLDKKTKELQEIRDKLQELKSQKTKLEEELVGYQTSQSYQEAIRKIKILEETIDKMKSEDKEYKRKIFEEHMWVTDKQKTMKEVLQNFESNFDSLKKNIENLTSLKRTFIGYNQTDPGMSNTDPEENSTIATDGDTIRRGNFDTMKSKDSGMSTGSKSSEQDDRHTDTIRSFLTKEDQLSTSINIGNYFNLVVAANIGTEGGELEIPGTKCSINIPPKAIIQQEDITVRIVPPETWLEESKSFASNSFSIIELLPNNLKLDKPAKVQIPHCLQIAKREKHEVEIYISHHEENCQPHWEKSTEHKYQLEDDVCTIYTSSFCWIKVEIDDQIVEAKKIQVFATVPTITPKDNRSVFTIGYYLDLPGFTNGMEPIEKKYFLFKKEKKQPLSIVLKKTVPKFWNNQPPSSPQEIPFSDIELSKDICCKFPLLKSRSCRGIPLCMFTVSQGKREITLSVRPPISSS